MADKEELHPGTEIWVKTADEGYVKALVEHYEMKPSGLTLAQAYKIGDKFTSYIDVRFLEGKHSGETIRLPLRYITYSYSHPTLPAISGDIEECNRRYSLKELRQIAIDHKVTFAGLTKLELCRQLVRLDIIK